MIKYKLKCNSCKLLFDSWFASSKEYDKLKKKNFLNCHNCNSTKIEKTLMAPKLLSKSHKTKHYLDEVNFKKINKKLREYQNFIQKNFDYVGNNFAYEARTIHYDGKKKRKGIYGTATKEELKELKEEGIKAQMIPWLDDNKN